MRGRVARSWVGGRRWLTVPLDRGSTPASSPFHGAGRASQRAIRRLAFVRLARDAVEAAGPEGVELRPGGGAASEWELRRAVGLAGPGCVELSGVRAGG